MLSRKYRRTARPGNRIATIFIIEHRAFFSNPVNIRGGSNLSYRMSVDTHCLTGMVIAHNENYIRSLLVLRCHPYGQQTKQTHN